MLSVKRNVVAHLFGMEIAKKAAWLGVQIMAYAVEILM